MPRISASTVNPMGSRRPGVKISLHGLGRMRVRVPMTGLRGLGLLDITQDEFLVPGYGDFSFSPGTPLATKIQVLNQYAPSFDTSPYMTASGVPTMPVAPAPVIQPAAILPGPMPLVAEDSAPLPGPIPSEPNLPISPGLSVTAQQVPPIRFLGPPVPSSLMPLLPANSVPQAGATAPTATAPAAQPANVISQSGSPAPAPQNLVSNSIFPASGQIQAGPLTVNVPQVVFDPSTGQIVIKQPSTLDQFSQWLDEQTIWQGVQNKWILGAGLLGLFALMGGGSARVGRKNR